MTGLSDCKALHSLCSVCGSLGVGWGLQVGTAAWADRVPGLQSLITPTNNEKVLLCPQYHWAIQEKRRKAWQKQMQGREAPNDPDIACNTFHCSYSWWQTIDYKRVLIFFDCNRRITLIICLPGVAIVTRETGLTVWSLSVVCAIALACLVVTVSLQWVTMAITLTRHTATAPCQGWTKAPGTAVLTMRPSGPIWMLKHEYRRSKFDNNKNKLYECMIWRPHPGIHRRSLVQLCR